MFQVEKIEKAVKSLSASELRRFRRWFTSFDAEAWDKQLEEDAASGKFDMLASAAIDDYESGNYLDLLRP